MHKKKQPLRFFLPSWVTTVAGLAVGAIITGAVIVSNQYQGSPLRQQIFEARQGTSSPLTDSGTSLYQTITTNIADNRLLSTLPLLLTWAAIGVVVYLFAISIAKSFGQAVALRDELDYVHVSRSDLLHRAFMELAFQLVALLGWFVLIKLSLSLVVPYALAVAHAAAFPLDLDSVGLAALSIMVWTVLVYVHAVALRLITLRPRLLSR